MLRKTMTVICALAMLVGCGDGPDTAAPDMILAGGGSYSCNFPMAMGRWCTDDVWTGTANSEAAEANACKSFGGAKVAVCDRAGAVGGCRTTKTGASGTTTSTSWFYQGTVDMVKSACTTTLKGTFVTP